jgi:hypothetical protein
LNRLVAAALALALVLVAPLAAPRAWADDATEVARGHYETGLELFYAREHAQALVEFQRAHEVKPRPATLFMMAQCEYLLGSLKQAREHYQAYLTESPSGEFVEVAKDRIESINRRPATLVINTVPDQADVRITPVDGSPPNATAATVPVVGQAPNNFSVPQGRWVVSVSKPNFLPQELTVQLGVAETKPLFFKLDPNPARLEIETSPAWATLYVNGNRAQNPYRQDVAPGRFELFAESTNYESRTQALTVGPGGRLLLTGPNAFRLPYVQRSGRPELVVASSIVGAVVGAGAVAAVLGKDLNTTGSAVSFALGGAVTGAIAGALIANNLVPSYIPDNRGLFVIGGMWMGAAEGALGGLVFQQARATATVNKQYPTFDPYVHLDLGAQLRSALIGTLPGLLLGTGTAALLTDRAPTYGRVALIQSAAAGGAVVGSLAAVALQWNPFHFQEVEQDRDAMNMPVGDPYLQEARSVLNLSLPALIGLNVGLGAGLLGAYLPDQSRYGPSWPRVRLIDLAAGAGALAGGVFACVADKSCRSDSTPDRQDADAARARAADVALIAAGLGLVGGIFLTRNVDRASPSTTSPSNGASAPSAPPTIGLFPTRDAQGGLTPMVAAAGLF